MTSGCKRGGFTFSGCAAQSSFFLVPKTELKSVTIRSNESQRSNLRELDVPLLLFVTTGV